MAEQENLEPTGEDNESTKVQDSKTSAFKREKARLKARTEAFTQARQ